MLIANEIAEEEKTSTLTRVNSNLTDRITLIISLVPFNGYRIFKGFPEKCTMHAGIPQPGLRSLPGSIHLLRGLETHLGRTF